MRLLRQHPGGIALILVNIFAAMLPNNAAAPANVFIAGWLLGILMEANG